MNIMLPLGTVRQAVNFLLPRIAAVDNLKNIVKHNIHFLSSNQSLKVPLNKNIDILHSLTLLEPVIPVTSLVRGLKYKTRLQLRCKDCFFVRKFDQMFVMCKSYPRHKQAAIKKKERNTWKTAFAMQSPKRPW